MAKDGSRLKRNLTAPWTGCLANGRGKPSGKESSPKRDHGCVLKTGCTHGRGGQQAKRPRCPRTLLAICCERTWLLQTQRRCLVASLFGKCLRVTPPPALVESRLSLARENLAPWLKSFESKVCHAPSWQAGARQRYREASVPVEGETYPTHPGRPALAHAGEERLPRQKSNYREFYRRKGVCQAGNSPGGRKLGKNRRFRPEVAAFQ